MLCLVVTSKKIDKLLYLYSCPTCIQKEMRSMARMRRVVNVGPDLDGGGRSSKSDLDALRQKQQRMKEAVRIGIACEIPS